MFVPLPVKSWALPAWGEACVTLWDSFDNKTVNPSLPSVNLTIVILSEIESAVAVIVTEVLLPKLAEVNVAVSPLPPNVTLGDELNDVALDMFCLFAVNVIVVGVIEPSLVINDWASADSLIDFALEPSLPLSAAWATENDCSFVKLALPSAFTVKFNEPSVMFVEELGPVKSATIIVLLSVPSILLPPAVTPVALGAFTKNCPVVGEPLVIPVNWVTPLNTIILVPLPVKVYAPPACVEALGSVCDSFVNTTV